MALIKVVVAVEMVKNIFKNCMQIVSYADNMELLARDRQSLENAVQNLEREQRSEDY